MSLSVVINTKNCASTLAKALASVEFADEIIVADMHSQDETVAIARQFHAQVFSVDDVGYVEPARNFAIKKATKKWILVLDADEEVSPGLKTEIQQIVLGPDANQADAYYLPRQNYIFDRWIKKTGWWPDYVLRLFKQNHVIWSEVIHSVPITKGIVKELPAQAELSIIHHNYQSVSQYLARLDRYTSIESQRRDTNHQPISATDLIQSFKEELFRRLFAQNGIEEGIHGVSLSFLQAMYQLIVKLKIWQADGFRTDHTDQDAIIKELRLFQRELNYWLADQEVRSKSGWQKRIWQLRRKLLI